MNFRTEKTLWSVVVCDLVEGKTIEATLTSDSSLSFDVENEVLRTYRLKRGGALESSVYTLPYVFLRAIISVLLANGVLLTSFTVKSYFKREVFSEQCRS
jgi:hypothetical protein